MKNFKRITKRGLSLFVALLMCMSVMSLTAFAEDEVTTDPVEIVEQVTEPTEETQDPVEVVEPAEDETPSEDPAHVEDEAPAEDPAPAEEEAPAEDAPPVEDEVPAEDPAPVEDEIPAVVTTGELTGMTITAAGAVNEDVNGTYVMTALDSNKVTDCVLALTADGPVSWTVSAAPAVNDLYVSSVSEDGSTVKLNFNVSTASVDLNGAQYALTLTANEAKTAWTGSFGAGLSGISLAELAGIMDGRTLQMAANAVNGNSAARRFLVNHYDGKVSLALCAPDAVIYTVTYQVSETNSFTMDLASGMVIPQPTPELASGQTFQGWYVDDNTALAAGATANGNITVYAKVDAPVLSPDEQFIENLENGVTVTIGDLPTWNLFVANADKAVTGGLVRLTADINCGGASYTSMTFKGSFDGGGNTISNATFTPATGHHFNGEEIDCCGMFASIGPGQVVANLNLDSITASSSTTTYSGALAGVVDGYPPKAIVQNVHVTNCTVRGRSAGGVAGFCRHANILYCSSEGGTIGGLANGGGIIGLVSDDSIVQHCFSKCSPTALSFMGGKAGGIGGKVVRSGNVNHCWCTFATVVSPADGGAESSNLGGVSRSTTADTFTSAGLSDQIWTFLGANTHFKDGVDISYHFTN